jgi:hypothetical protein
MDTDKDAYKNQHNSDSNPKMNAAILKLTLDKGREKYTISMQLSNQKILHQCDFNTKFLRSHHILFLTEPFPRKKTSVHLSAHISITLDIQEVY